MERSEFIRKMHECCELIETGRFTFSCTTIRHLFDWEAYLWDTITLGTIYVSGLYCEIMAPAGELSRNVWLTGVYNDKREKEHRILSLLLFKEFFLDSELYKEL